MWWWALTSPGVTRQPPASIRSRAGGSAPAPPTPLITPCDTATQPPGTSRRSSSRVATSVALAISRSTGDAGAVAFAGASLDMLVDKARDVPRTLPAHERLASHV